MKKLPRWATNDTKRHKKENSKTSCIKPIIIHLVAFRSLNLKYSLDNFTLSSQQPVPCYFRSLSWKVSKVSSTVPTVSTDAIISTVSTVSTDNTVTSFSTFSPPSLLSVQFFPSHLYYLWNCRCLSYQYCVCQLPLISPLSLTFLLSSLKPFRVSRNNQFTIFSVSTISIISTTFTLFNFDHMYCLYYFHCLPTLLS